MSSPSQRLPLAEAPQAPIACEVKDNLCFSLEPGLTRP